MSARVLVVIPTLNEAPRISEVISSLMLDMDVGTEVWVVDGGSSDATQDIVKRISKEVPGVRLVHNEKRLQSAAVNIAIQEARPGVEILIRCDAHAVYPAGYVRRLVNSLERSRSDSVVVPMDSEGTGCFQRAVAWVSDSRLGNGGSAHRGGRVSGFVDHGHHAAFRMSALRVVGGYDASFSHNEDAELDCRLRAMGYRIYLDSEIRLTYFPRATLRALWRQYRAYGAGRARTVKRHPESISLRQMLVPAHVILCLICLGLEPWAPYALAWPGTYLMALAMGSILIAIRHHSGCGLLAGLAAATMHVAWATGFLWGFAGSRDRAWKQTPGVSTHPPGHQDAA